MIFSLLLGAVAAWMADKVEAPLKDAIESLLPDGGALEGAELRLISVALCLFVAAIAASLLAHGNAIALTLGAVIGAFGPRVMAYWKGRSAPDYDS